MTASGRSELRCLARDEPLLQRLALEVLADEHDPAVAMPITPRLDGIDLEQLVHALQRDLARLARRGR